MVVSTHMCPLDLRVHTLLVLFLFAVSIDNDAPRKSVRKICL